MSKKDNTSEFDNEDFISDFKSLRLSALKNAARISPFVSGVTIGPNSTFQGSDSSKITVTFRNDLVKPVKDDEKVKHVRVTFNANEDSRKVELVNSSKNKLDLATINQKSVLLSAEKQRKDIVKKELSERNVRLIEEAKKMQSKVQVARIESQKRLQQKEQKNEKLLQEHFNQMDLADREFAENQKQQLLQQRKRVSDVSFEIKKREESIKQRDLAIEGFRGTQSLFKVQMELFTKNYQGVREEQKPQFANSKKMVVALMKNIEIIAQKVYSSNTISASDLELADKLLSDITKVNNEVVALCKVHEQQLMENQEKEKAKELEDQAKLLQLKQAQDAVDSKAKQAASKPQITANQGNFVNNSDLARYSTLLEVFERFSVNEQQLAKIPNLGSYRLRLIKAINMPCNAISAKDPQFLLDKFERLSSLLSGNSVQSGSDETVSTNEHPFGKDFSFVYLGKKFVNLGDTVISSHTQAAYSIAAVLVALWQRFPELGQLFLAQLYKECPYLVPIFLPQREGQSDREYYGSLGCRYDEQGVREDVPVYMKRITGFTRLFAAIVVTQTRRGETNAHPQGLREGWNFLASFMNLEPLPDISALIILEFLQVAGDALQRSFGQQFNKMMRAVHEQYIPKLDGSGSYKSRLEAFIVKVLTEGKFEDTGEALPPNFW